MKPTIGRIVHYALTTGDAEHINKRRRDFEAFNRAHPQPVEAGQEGSTGHVGHFGNPVTAGDVFPAVIVRVWPPATGCNLQVLLDGNDHFWATSRTEGHGFGHWAWPVIEHPEPEEAPAG